MTSKDLALTVVGAKSGTSGILTFSLDELNRCKGQLLGKGAFGVVHAVKDHPTLAVKEIWLKGQPDRLVEITKFELETMSQFSHPGVLKYHQILTKGEFFYVVMDRYSSDLDKFIAKYRKNREPIPKELLLSILKQLADALAYVHAPYKVNEKGDVLPGIVHRDLKPDNVLMSKNGERVAIADFGLCKDAQHDGRTLAGTKAYMAPETFIHRKTSRASDIWALGVIIYELATLGRPNFSRQWEPEDARKYFVDGWKPDLSDVKDDFIRGILEKIFVLDPIERPTAGELRAFLWALNASDTEAKLHINELEAALKDAHTKNISLEEGLQIQSKEINSLRDTVATQAAELNFLRESLKKLAAQDPSWTPLMRATAAGDIKAVKRHLSRKDKNNNDGDAAYTLAVKIGQGAILELLDPTDERGVTALMRAAEKNDVEAVKTLVTKQRKLRDSDGRTALMHAAERGYAEIAAALAPHERGLTDDSGNTALMLAASNAHTEAVRVLIEHEKGMSDNQEHNALYYALKNGHIEDVDFLIEADDPTDENGVTALMRAAARGDAEMVELLAPLQKGMKDKDGSTAFIHALGNKHADTATVLREYEAPSWTPLMRAALIGDIETAKQHLSDKDTKNDDGDTALMIAAKAGHMDVVELLDPTTSQGVTALMRAAERGDVDTARALIPSQKGKRSNGSVKINDYEIHEGTALMIAAACGHTEVVEVLVEHEGGIRASRGYTALMWTAYRGHTECVGLLLEREAGVQSEDGWTALAHAAEGNHSECVRLLMKHESSVSGWTSLICAAYLGDINAVRDNLHEKGRKDDVGMTALMWAAHQGHKGVVEVLLEHEKGAKDNQNHSALYHALKSRHMEVAEVIMLHEDPADGNGVTELMRAAARGDIDMVRLLIPNQKGGKDKNKRTAFQYALENRHIEIATLLYEHEVPSWTPLMCAAFLGDIETAKQHLSDKDKKNDDGDTAYTLAAKAGQGAMLELIDPTGYWNGVTALMRAAERGDVEAVRALMPLQKGKTARHAKINGWEMCEGTALMMAAAYGHTEVVRLLAEKEAGMQENDGWTALMYAARRDQADCIRLLLDKEGGMQDKDGWTALMVAAKYGHIKCVRMLVEKEGGMMNNDRQTALMWAARNGHPGCVRLLLEKEGGMQKTGICNKGKTALMMAAEYGHLECVKLLVKKEGGMQAAGIWNEGETALMWAAENGHSDCVKLLLEREGGMQKNDGKTALMRAAYDGYTECVKLLLEKEKGIQDRDGWTALMSAARYGHTECVKLLVEKESGMQDKDGRTTLMLAAINGHIECVELLLEKEKGMKTTHEWCECPLGSTALILAAQCRQEEVVKLLMEHEGSISGWTKLIYAAYRGDVDAVRNNLHEKKCKDVTEMTALMWAAQRGFKEIVEVLLEHEKGMRDNQNYNALYYALTSRHTEVIEIIIPHEDPTDDNGGTALVCAAFFGDIEAARRHLSDKDKKNSDRGTALMIAARAGHEDIVELLDPTTSQGVTALMRAATRGDVEAVRALIPLQKGKTAGYVEIGRWEMFKGTALMMAASYGHTEVVKLLVEHEGGMRDMDGMTALMYAVYDNKLECARLLAESEKEIRNKGRWTALNIAQREGHTEIVSILFDSIYSPYAPTPSKDPC